MQNRLSSNLDTYKEQAKAWFEHLRNLICTEFEKIERELGSDAKFIRQSWERHGGGGGVMSKMSGGRAFEKVGVNISTVYGNFDPKFAGEIPGTENSTEFWASGISLVAHMESPYVPAVHMNTRFIATGKSWFGGGADLTPTFEYAEDTQDFHASFKAACDKFDTSYYPKFKEHCDEYFFLKHRNEPRGIGGIFYDNLSSGNHERDFDLTKSIGLAFLNIYPEIVRRHYKKSWIREEKDRQLIKRGRYVEFNLLYDRGTRFGFMTGGNPEAILMSMPPLVRWE
jgi:coproporphyrinogen III oxidase